MFKNAIPILIKAITPIHAGVGRALGFIDMPIQKENYTGIPKIEGSTIKGSMRELYRVTNGENIDKLFGSENGSDNAGIIGFTDARLLFYPIITLDGVFAYVTCPYLLNGYLENKSIMENKNKSYKFKRLLDGKCVILRNKNDTNQLKNIVLDEYCFEVDNTHLEKIDLDEFNLNLERYAVIISDNDFIELISLCKEIVRRNRIDEQTGTVNDGSLFMEEYLPSESILYTLVLQNYINDNEKLYKKYIETFPKVCQIGGNFTIGKGIVNMQVIGGENYHE